MAGRFVLKSSNEQFMFNLKAGNAETILTSERYTRKESLLGGVAAVRACAPVNERYQRKTSQAGEPYFVLRSANNEVIGTSEMYSSAAARDGGIEAVKAAAPTASIDDQL